MFSMEDLEGSFGGGLIRVAMMAERAACANEGDSLMDAVSI